MNNEQSKPAYVKIIQVALKAQMEQVRSQNPHP
jgi:hypothetical protein